MFNSFIVVFREGFEMAIIISLLLASTQALAGAKKYILGGVAVGLGLSLSLGLVAANSSTLTHLIQSKVTSVIILFAVSALVASTVIWMRTQGRALNSKIATSLSNPNIRSTYMSLATIATLTILREGGETVVFLITITMQGDTSKQAVALGGLLGAGAAFITGVLMYLGLLKVNIKKMFTFFSTIMSFLAAGLFAHGVAKLISLHWVNPIIPHLWDTSAVFNHHTNPLALLLHVAVGYTERPSLLEVLSYLAVLAVIWLLSKRVENSLNLQDS